MLTIVICLCLGFGLLILFAAMEQYQGVFTLLLGVVVAFVGLLLALVIDGLTWIEGALRSWSLKLEGRVR